MLGQCLPGMAASEAPMLSEATVGMVAACFRPTAEARARAEAQMTAATLRRIKRHIEARLDAPNLSPASLAAAFAYRAPRSTECLSPWAGHEIAFDCGFASEAHFSRRFRDAYGVTPTAWRREATVPAHVDRALEEYNYARWIARLRAD
jgi:AraC-like DNA-binding protein